jgi:1-acyl-sn-glycerol-3-phosphate acyltransferase
MTLTRQLIGVFSLLLVAIVFVAGDVWGRLVVEPVGRLFPDRREAVIRAHLLAMRNQLLWILRRVGRARFDVGPRIPCRAGVLVIMNHQSLLDIPAAALMVPDAYPRFVTHYRYARGIPLISHMIRLMGSIPVYPGKTGRAELERLVDAARTSEYPIVLYPEGHRSRDGEIRPWKRGALDAFLSARAWTVHVVVVDGLWQVARIPDFIRNLTRVRSRIESAGVFEYDGRGRASHDEFVERARAAMCDKLADMRRAPRDENLAARELRQPHAAEPAENP